MLLQKKCEYNKRRVCCELSNSRWSFYDVGDTVNLEGEKGIVDSITIFKNLDELKKEYNDGDVSTSLLSFENNKKNEEGFIVLEILKE